MRDYYKHDRRRYGRKQNDKTPPTNCYKCGAVMETLSPTSVQCPNHCMAFHKSHYGDHWELELT